MLLKGTSFFFFFFLLCSVPLCEFNTLFILFLMDIWVVSCLTHFTVCWQELESLSLNLPVSNEEIEARRLGVIPVTCRVRGRASVRPLLPDSQAGAFSTENRNTKLPQQPTESSWCLLMGSWWPKLHIT